MRIDDVKIGEDYAAGHSWGPTHRVRALAIEVRTSEHPYRRNKSKSKRMAVVREVRGDGSLAEHQDMEARLLQQPWAEHEAERRRLDELQAAFDERIGNLKAILAERGIEASVSQGYYSRAGNTTVDLSPEMTHRLTEVLEDGR